jgi:hypothetical protein
VNSGRDEIDTWLEREVNPLAPRPGTLDQIRRTARRRKTTQAVFAAAGCAVIIGVAAAVPQLTAGLHHSPGSHSPPPAAQGSSSVSLPISTPAPSSQSVSSSPVQGARHSHSLLSASTSGVAAPVDFRPTSVTFVGTDTGADAEVGAVLGQAGNGSHPCADPRDCTSLAGTSTYGKSWYGVSAPETPGPSGSTGVSQLRFDDLTHGWAFGPGLWETSKGGWPWIQEPTFGMRVTDLETAKGHALAIFASCSGTGRAFAADCTSFSLYSSVAGSASWTPVAVPASFQHMTTSAPSAATLVIAAGSTGYLLTPSGAVLTGPVAGGAWTKAGTAPCRPAGAQASGQPAGAQLATGTSLVLACDSTGTSTIYTSATGAHWTLAGTVPTSGTATSLASSSSGTTVLATTGGIYYAASGGSWHSAKITGSARGGFTYVGMTTASFGVAVPADAQLNEIYVTSNGGKTWTPAPITT